MEATRRIAARKNAPVAVDRCEKRVDDLMQFLRAPDLAEEFVDGDPKTVALMEAYIDVELDGSVVRHILYQIAKAQGIAGGELDWEVFGRWVHEIFLRMSARHSAGSFYRWSDLGSDPVAALAEFSITTVDLREAPL